MNRQVMPNGDTFFEARRKLGWSQETLANNAIVSKRTIQRMEAASRPVTPDTHEAVVEALRDGFRDRRLKDFEELVFAASSRKLSADRLSEAQGSRADREFDWEMDECFIISDFRWKKRDAIRFVYDTLHEVCTEFNSRRAARNQRRRLEIYGHTLKTGWPEVEDLLMNVDQFENWDVEILRFSSQCLQRHKRLVPSTWPKNRRNTDSDIRSFLREHGGDLIRRGIHLAVCDYDYLSPYHGFRVRVCPADDHSQTIDGELLISFLEWSSSGGGNVKLRNKFSFYDRVRYTQPSTRMQCYWDLFDRAYESALTSSSRVHQLN